MTCRFIERILFHLDFRRKAEDKKKVFNPVLVKFRSFKQKVKIMKEKKKLANADLKAIGKNERYQTMRI